MLRLASRTIRDAQITAWFPDDGAPAGIAGGGPSRYVLRKQFVIVVREEPGQGLVQAGPKRILKTVAKGGEA